MANTSKFSVIEFSFAVVDFATQEITWKPGGFTPKRRSALLNYFENKRAVDIAWLENLA